MTENARIYWLVGAGLAAAAATWFQVIHPSSRHKTEESKGEAGTITANQQNPLYDSQLTFMAMFQLPGNIMNYVNQEREIAGLISLVKQATNSEARQVVISAITGQAGIGKTALAIRVAHEMSNLFPDGELYVNLRGYDSERRDPFDVLGDFLRALGVEGIAIPRTLEQRSLMYRARMSQRRTLVVLDNAYDESQVRPLLPGNPRCAVIVTSRSRLAGLEHARSVSIELLDPPKAVELLTYLVGEDRLAAEPGAAEAIVKLCGYLPLAIRIVGAKLVAKPHWKLSLLVERMQDERLRLRELNAGDIEVRSSFMLSYIELPPEVRRLFRFLGIIETLDFPAWIADVLLNDPNSDGFALLERLVDVQLLEPAGQDSVDQYRYRFHDLIRLFARELLYQEEESGVIAAAFGRLVGTYLVLAEKADTYLQADGRRDIRECEADRLDPPPQALAAINRGPLSWFEMERLCLIKLIEDTHQRKIHAATWQLAATLTWYFDLSARWREWRDTHELALDSAETLRDPYAKAVILWSLGTVHWYDARWRSAIEALSASIELFAQLGENHERALASRNLGVVYRDQSRWTEARECYQVALGLFEASGDRRRTALTWRNLGDVYRDQGDYVEAQEFFDRCAAIYDEVNDSLGVAYMLRSRGDAYWGEGRYEEALHSFEACLLVFRGLRDRRAEGRTLRNIGLVYRDQERTGDAEVYLERSIEVFRELGDQHGEARTLQCIGELYHMQGRMQMAYDCYQKSLEVFRDLGDQLWQGKALAAQGQALLDQGNGESAAERWRDALAIFEALGVVEADEVRARLTNQ